jgi:hypothetical protein
MSIKLMSRDELIDVKLARSSPNNVKRREEDDQKQSISNCPYNLITLIHDQGLDCVFGHKDHRVRG